MQTAFYRHLSLYDTKGSQLIADSLSTPASFLKCPSANVNTGSPLELEAGARERAALTFVMRPALWPFVDVMADEEHPNEREYLRDFDTTRTSLPIFGYRDELIRAVSEYPVLVVCGDTGSGKTTQLPQYLLETDPSLRIAVTQPRRIAAISAAQRVAAETGSGLGTTVGFCVRFETVAAPDSKIVYMTDGALLRRIASSSLADVADVVVLDEAHERSLETDLLFGILKERMASSQPRLRLIVMSATLDMDKFSAFFGDAPVFTVPGRMYPVHLLYAKRMKWAALKGQIVSKCVEAVLQIHQSQPQGDILVFLTGQSEIETCARLIATELDSLNPRDFAAYPAVQDLSIHPIYSALDTPDQKQVFRPARPGCRKCVLATNIAQTSVTIPGIRYVVDCGFVKEKMYDPATGVDALIVVPVSKAAATQRAGRAGRTAPGKVFRLYSKDAFDELETDTTPEIQRSSLLGTVLTLKEMGIKDVLQFQFIDPPERDSLITAMKQLYYLNALDSDGNLTPIGLKMSRIPAHPTLAAALLASANHACTADLLTLTAILSSEEIFVHPRQEHKRIEAETSHAHFGHPSGDHVALLRVYDAWINARESDTWCQKHYIRSRSLRIVKTARAQLEEILRGFGIDTSTTRRHASHRNRRHRRRDSTSSDSDPLADYDASPILQSLSAGLFTNTAKRHPHRPHFYHYLSSTAAHPSSGNSLLCLYTSPNSTLAGPVANGGGAGISDGTRGDVEWVLYQDVQFVTRANMRVVSSVQFEWVKEGLARVASCDVDRLIGVMKEPAGKRKRELEGSEGPESRKNSLQAEKEERREEVEEGVVEREKLEREAKAAAAKLRYLSRKKK